MWHIKKLPLKGPQDVPNGLQKVYTPIYIVAHNYDLFFLKQAADKPNQVIVAQVKIERKVHGIHGVQTGSIWGK